jgi:hypothetical protein
MLVLKTNSDRHHIYKYSQPEQLIKQPPFFWNTHEHQWVLVSSCSSLRAYAAIYGEKAKPNQIAGDAQRMIDSAKSNEGCKSVYED